MSAECGVRSAECWETREAPGKGQGVFARRKIVAGWLVVQCPGTRSRRRRTDRTIQVGWGRHWEFEDPAMVFNHSCAPNCRLVLVGGAKPKPRWAQVTALREIAKGEELTWDYATTEAYSVSVPECRCGAPNCRGRAMGFLEVPPMERVRLVCALGLGVAPYLRVALPD